MAPRLTGSHFVNALNGSPAYLGTIVATTTKNNNDTAAPFSNTGAALTGKLLVIQPDSACYILAGTTTTTTVTAANGVKLAADQIYYITMAADEGWLACLAFVGTTNLKLWEAR